MSFGALTANSALVAVEYSGLLYCMYGTCLTCGSFEPFYFFQIKGLWSAAA
jgi:hypothetical protein